MPSITFYTLAGVARAELLEDRITVVQKNPLPELKSNKGALLCSEFANWSADPEEVLRFTRRYGALRAPLEPGAEYTFLVRHWVEDQKRIRSAWGMTEYVFRKFDLHRWGELGEERISVEEGEAFVFRFGRLEYKTQSLFRLLLMELLSTPKERLQLCLRSGCVTPHFVARHLRQKYCSDLCAQSAQRDSKRKWWEQHGEQWRRRRADVESEQVQTKDENGGGA